MAVKTRRTGRAGDLRLTLSVEADQCKVAIFSAQSETALATDTSPLPDFCQFEELYMAPLRQNLSLGAEKIDEMAALLRSTLLPQRVAEILARETARGPVRLRLLTEEKEASAPPWEYVFAPSKSGADVCLIREAAVSQFGTSKKRADGRTALVVWANPDSPRFPHLASLAIEKRSVAEALRNGGFTVDELPYATPSTLLRRLGDDPVDIVHFVGHGVRLPTGSALVLESGNLHVENFLYGKDLADMLAVAGVQLVVLSGCHTGAPDSGLGSPILEAGVPAVIAMQLPVRDKAAQDFAQRFYRSYAQGREV